MPDVDPRPERAPVKPLAGFSVEATFLHRLRTPWTYEDALLLLSGLQPKLTKWDMHPAAAIFFETSFHLSRAVSFPDGVEILDAAELEAAASRIMHVCLIRQEVGEPTGELPVCEWLEFAQQNSIEVAWLEDARRYPRVARLLPPQPSSARAETDEAKPSLPDYLNPRHPMFPPELRAAVEAWCAVTKDGDPRARGRATLAVLVDWLKANKSRLGISQTAIDRIAPVANWNKVGGSPRTPSGG